MAPRAYWKGNLRLSLVSCPIELFPATSERDKISFNQINRHTGNRVRYKKVDARTGEELLNDDIVKAYQFEKDHYVQFDPEELDAIALDSTRSIEIISFVPESEIDALYYNAPYFIAPQEGDYANEAFAVIREALDEKGMVGIGRVVFSSREHMIAISPRGKGMLGVTLHYPYEVRKEVEYFDDIPDLKIDREMIGMAHQLIKSKAGHFQPAAFKDRYEDALKELVEKKRKGVTLRGTPAAAPAANVVNLMDALRRSVSEKAPASRRTRDTGRSPQKKAARSVARSRKAG